MSTSSHKDGDEVRLSASVPAPNRRRMLLLLPIGIFGGLAGAFGIALGRNHRGIVRSALIGDPVPEFSLPPVRGRTLGLATDNLIGQVSLVNVFASWCAPCRVEHPLFLDLHRRGIVPIHGINHKDQPENAAAWLDRLGDPYMRTGADVDGRASIEWGVYGVPETFVVDRSGTIVHKHVGPLSEAVVEQTILPLVARLRA